MWSPDDWKTIEFSWGETQPMAFQDGDRFSLTVVNGTEQVLLFEQVVTFQIVQDCAGSCQYARYDLQGVTFPQGGASNSGDAGAGFGGAEAGSSGEGGAR